MADDGEMDCIEHAIREMSFALYRVTVANRLTTKQQPERLSITGMSVVEMVQMHQNIPQLRLIDIPESST